MEPSRYYDCAKGDTYCVHFPNKPGYSISEITNIFSEFGEVAGVTKAGDDYGFRFVRFVREEDVLRCIASLKYHPTIKLLPKKQKQGNDQRQNWTTAQDSRETKGRWANWEQKKSENGGDFRRDNGQRTGNRDYNNRFSDAATTEKNQWNSNEKPQVIVNNFAIPTIPQINNKIEPNKESETQAKKVPEVQSFGVDTPKPADSSPAQEIAAKDIKVADPAIISITPAGSCKSAKSSKTPLLQTVTEETIGISNNNADEKISKNIVATTLQTIPLIISDDLPKLVEKHKKAENATEMKNPSRGAVPKTKTVEAEAIVVGNVHPEYGVHYILHLFQKHNPISVSPMNIVTKQGLRYCIVYLQTSLQARDIEEEFDNYDLSGKQLIVMRAEKLLQLASDA